MPKTMTVEEASAELRLSEQTVWRYIREGKLSARKVGRRYLIPAAEVEALQMPLERPPPNQGGEANA